METLGRLRLVRGERSQWCGVVPRSGSEHGVRSRRGNCSSLPGFPSTLRSPDATAILAGRASWISSCRQTGSSAVHGGEKREKSTGSWSPDEPQQDSYLYHGALSLQWEMKVLETRDLNVLALTGGKKWI